MRCPKCSFTSFDHLVTCEKCGRDLTELIEQLHGTSLRVKSPMFLDATPKAPAGEEMLDIGGGSSIPDPARDEGGDSSMDVEEEVVEAAVAEEATPVVEAVEEKISLDFEGLDLSDLTPADKSGATDKGGGAEENPLDLWALNSSADEDLADLFDDLVPVGKGKKKTAPTDESSAAETTEESNAAADETGAVEDDKPKEDDTRE
jgi:hypothetical protein